VKLSIKYSSKFVEAPTALVDHLENAMRVHINGGLLQGDILANVEDHSLIVAIENEKADGANNEITCDSFVYLTNSLGEDTGYGHIEVTEADMSKIGFESELGHLLQYLVEKDGVLYLKANWEVAYQDSFWRENSEAFMKFDDAKYLADRVYTHLLSKATDGVLAVENEYGMPGRIVISVAIPMSTLDDAYDSTFKIKSLFNPYRLDLGPELQIEHVLRMQIALANFVFEEYKFGEGATVSSHDNWDTSDKGDFTKIVYYKLDSQGPSDDSLKASFHVKFSNDGNASESYALCMDSGVEIGTSSF
jgi:hypothetical protein